MRGSGGEGMIVYWDLVLLFNFLTDYLLLFCTVQLSGFGVKRLRLTLSALLGAVYAVVQLVFPRNFFCLLAVLMLMGAQAFFGTGRALKLTLLFAALSCALGGTVLLFGQLSGSLERIAHGLVFAELPWGVFFAAAVLCYLILGIVFRCGARHTGGELAQVTITYRGKRAALTLLRDTGNTLTDAQTGTGIPVVSERAVRDLLSADEIALLPCIPYRCVGTQEGHLPVFRCDELSCDGVSLGARLVAVSPNALGGGTYVGLWCEGSERRQNVQKALA